MPSQAHTARSTVLTAALLLALILSGCGIGGTSRPAEFYILTALPEGTEPLAPAGTTVPDIGIGQVQIPSYLDRPQIVTKITENQIHLSEFHRWGEALQNATTRILRENTAILLGGGGVSAFPWLQPFPNDYLVHVVILDFEASSHTGNVTLRVMYRVTDTKTKQTVLVRESEFRQPIATSTTGDNYKAIVDAMSATLADLAQAFSKELIQLPLPTKS